MGALRLGQNRLAEAESLFTRAGAADPKEPAHAMNLARACVAQGRADDAISAYRAAIKLNPALAPAYLELAGLQQRAGRLQEAEATLRRLLRAMPDHAQAKLMLGMVLMESGRPGDAETLLRRALGEASDTKTQASLRNGLAWSIRRQNRHEESLAELEAVHRLDPSLPYGGYPARRDHAGPTAL